MLEMAAFWAGKALPPHSAACLASFTRHGHATRLYCYEPVQNAPRTAEIFDAGKILDRKIFERFAALGKYAQFANFFRYELLAQQDGLCWIDADIYCLKPIEADTHIFGWEDNRYINNAVLALPSGSPLLQDLRAMFLRDDFVAPWLGWRQLPLYRLMALLGRPVPRENYPWGSLGPGAVTWYARKHGMIGVAKPCEAFFPVSYRQTDLFFDPSIDWEKRLSASTRTIHLYNEVLRRDARLHEPPKDSLIWKIVNGGI